MSFLLMLVMGDAVVNEIARVKLVAVEFVQPWALPSEPIERRFGVHHLTRSPPAFTSIYKYDALFCGVLRGEKRSASI